MLDDVLKEMYDSFIKKWLKKYYKYILVILLYFLYQSNFLISLLYSFGLNITSLAKIIRTFIIYVNDLVYIFILIYMFKDEIKNGIKDFKNNKNERLTLSLICWLVGCLIMVVSTFIISLITKSDVSNNEELIRESIKVVPIYMFFTCSIVAPLFEEMVFRNALYGLIKNKYIFIITSFLSFGLLHIIGTYTSPLDLLYVIPYGAMGASFAYLLTKTKNITLPIMIHMLHNTILVIVQIIGR